MTTVIVAVERGAGPKEVVVGVLQEIVGEPAVAGRPRQIEPELTRRCFVEDAERFFRHLEGALGLVERTKALEIREGGVNHGWRALAERVRTATR